MKERYYPNYITIFILAIKSIIVKRRCVDGVVRHIQTMTYNSIEEAEKEFDQI